MITGMTATVNHPFVGEWVGKWFAESGITGEWTLTISPDGAVTGAAFDSRTGRSATMTGIVTPDGVFTYEYTYTPRTRTGKATIAPTDGQDSIAITWRDYDEAQFPVSVGVSRLTRQKQS